MKENLDPVTSESQSVHSDRQPHSEEENVEVVKDLVHRKVKCVSKKAVKQVAVTKTERALYQKMLQVGVKLSKCRSKVKKQAIKIKALQNITTNPQFLETLDKMSSTSKILTLLQFREHKKEKKGGGCGRTAGGRLYSKSFHKLKTAPSSDLIITSFLLMTRCHSSQCICLPQEVAGSIPA
ncbi:uncharacterized protein LOC135116931 [Helicoverpa armigera]|uniref:uncharacterized protein LOC135116931 n=1 Tax=Helicoverpa armigera TaxID=29058 RepID=UPI0030832F3E